MEFSLAAAFAAILAAATPAHAQSADALIDKLVEKGILTQQESDDLRKEAKQGFDQAFSSKTGMPKYVKGYKFGGDFRGRVESFWNDNPAFRDRTRYRYRLRAGITVSLENDLDIGFRLGSGDIDSASKIASGIDPISNNQTFQNNGSKKGIFIDLAYARWSPLHSADWEGALTLGKMSNPFVFSDMVFDHDYNPEGAAVQLAYTLSEGQQLGFNGGGFVVDESGKVGDDPWFYGTQLRWDSKWTPDVSSSFGVSYLSLQSQDQLPSSAVPDSNVGNTRLAGVSGGTVVLGAPVYAFNPFVLDASVTYTLDHAPLYPGRFPIKVFGEYMNNPGAPSGANTGWNAGIAFGKAGKRRTWELSYRYKYLESDAWWEEFVDSDSGGYYAGPVVVPPPLTLQAPGAGYGSGTNIKGHVIKATYSPYDAWSLSFTYFGMELINPYVPGTDGWMNRIQGDIAFKF